MNEWHIGDPVDWGDGWMDAQNWGRTNDDDDEKINQFQTDSSDSQRDEYSRKAWECYLNFREKEALDYINMALDLDRYSSNNWNRKAIILEALKRYKESEECYNKSLELSPTNIVYDNKARMLYAWAAHLMEESKTRFDMLILEDAKLVCKRAIDTIPGIGSEENPEKYHSLMDSIEFNIGYQRQYQINIDVLKRFDKDELFTITGTNHYPHVSLTRGMALRLLREPDNKFDSDAIAVYAGDDKIGYVANRDYTKFKMTSSASDLCKKIENSASGEYLMYLDRYSSIQFYIGRITDLK